MKLRTKIQLFSSLFMFILILVVNIAIYFSFYKLSTDTELAELEILANDISQVLKDNPGVEVNGIIAAHVPSNGMIRVISEKDLPFIIQTRSKDYLKLGWKFSNVETKKVVNQKGAPDIVVVEKPVIWNYGERKGEVVTIQVSNHLVTFHDTLRTLFYVLAVLTIVALIPVILGSSVLSKFLLKPIQNLIETMKINMRQDNWEKIDVGTRSKDEIHEMEKTFNEMIDHLKVSYEKQEMFVSDASHELKTPIQIIKSYAQLLERRGNVNPEVFKESIGAIDSEADRMKKLVEQMLAMAKNKQVNSWEDVHFIDLIRETVGRFQHVSERNIELFENVDHLLVKGNRDQLEQVLYILIDNALRYSQEKIEVHVKRVHDEVILQVKDYGKGISKEDQTHIFDRFYRVDKARNRETGGTGLGLSIAKTIVDAHGGDLFVESELDVGTTFTLKLEAISESEGI